MNSIRSCFFCRIENLLDVEIRFLRRVSCKRERNIRLADEKRGRIVRRMGNACCVAAFLGGTNHAPRNFAAIGNKDIF